MTKITESQKGTLEPRIREFLEDLYSDSSVAPSEEKLEDEVKDLVNEVNTLYRGSFDKWYYQWLLMQESEV